MDELRSEIRAAFEKEQAAHPPAAGLRRNLSAAAATQSRPAPNLQWIAVAAAALLGILVVAGLMSTRLAPRANVPGTTKTPPVGDYGPPPAGVPLLYVHDPNNPSWLIGYDWSGKPRGTVKLALSTGVDPVAVQMAPDGSAFEVGGTYKGGTGTLLDRLGVPIPEPVPSTDVVGAMWADDNRHQCLVTLNQQTLVWGLNTWLPGEAAHKVAVLARDHGVGQTGLSVAACSIATDRAILVRTTISWASELWVVKLSNGQVLSHRSYVGGMVANIVASRDAAYVAQMPGLGVDNLRGLRLTVILRVSDWTVVGDLREGTQVLGFSGDGSLALVSNLQQQAVQPPILTIVNWRSNATVWTDQDSATLGGFIAQPGGRAFALVFTTSGSVTPGIPDPLATILIVKGDGSVTKFPRLYKPTW